jgi:hypothetical protein
MNVNTVLALVGLALAGASMAAGGTIPAEAPWYVHTAIAAIQGASAAVLLVVDPTALARLRPVLAVVPTQPTV